MTFIMNTSLSPCAPCYLITKIFVFIKCLQDLGKKYIFFFLEILRNRICANSNNYRINCISYAIQCPYKKTTKVMLHYLKHLIPILPWQSRKYSRQPINSSPWQFDQSYFFSRNKNSAERQSMKRWPDRSRRRDISSVGSSAREKAY